MNKDSGLGYEHKELTQAQRKIKRNRENVCKKTNLNMTPPLTARGWVGLWFSHNSIGRLATNVWREVGSGG